MIDTPTLCDRIDGNIPPLIRFAAKYKGIDLDEVKEWNLTLFDIVFRLRDGKERSVALAYLLEARVTFPDPAEDDIDKRLVD